MNKKTSLLMLAKYVARRYADAHEFAAVRYGRRGLWLTIINIAAGVLILFLSANGDAAKLVDFSINGLNQRFGTQWPVTASFVLGLAGAINVITSSLQFLLKYEERQIRHSYALAEYLNIHREIEQLLTREFKPGGMDEAICDTIRDFNHITKFAPNLSSKFIKKQEAVNKKIIELQEQLDKLGATEAPVRGADSAATASAEERI